MKWKIWDVLLVAGVVLMTVGLGLAMKQSEDNKPKMELIKNSAKQKSEILGVTQVISKVKIDISGEVKKPGVYELTNNERIDDLIKAAGGLSKSADSEWVEKNINKAERLKDGMKVYIPEEGEQMTNLAPKAANSGGLVNINIATKEELEKLSGVGPALAQKIIDYREQYGGFKTIEEIQLVPGIGPKMFEKIKSEIEI